MEGINRRDCKQCDEEHINPEIYFNITLFSCFYCNGASEKRKGKGDGIEGGVFSQAGTEARFLYVYYVIFYPQVNDYKQQPIKLF